MRAPILVDLLLELNVINVKDIDREMNQLAAGVYDPRAVAWMKRVARYFVINIEQLLAPKKAKAELRGGSRYQGGHEGAEQHEEPSKYHLHPSGKWVGTTPSHFRSQYELKLGDNGEWKWVERRTPVPPEQNVHGTVPSELEPGAWRTQFHQPEIKKQIGQNFTPFAPKKAKAKGILWGPPTKDKLEPWMQGYKKPKSTPPEEGTPEHAKAEFHGQLYHFDPIVVRRRELFLNLNDTVSYFNWVYTLAQRKIDEDDQKQPAQAAPAEKLDAFAQQETREARALLRTLETMKTADIDGFNEVMQQTKQFMDEVKNNPEKFSSNKPTPVMTFPDRYVWVHLHTKEQFRLEGERMAHCIGGSYFCKFEQGTHDYYSLRNPQGVPKISMEVARENPPRILQIRAYGNHRPAPEYQPYLRPFITQMGFNAEDQEEYID